ncbi:hypothetical protein RSA3_09120 [Microbacterium testaceum]|uniref:Uncharacterized protein n=2 Tax=Microbacterium testaceum TaxID=2033 RepID=A0A147F7C4_MICTE|nr:hypothetical protein RSA3_09120 [Microbacterium testaceum]
MLWHYAGVAYARVFATGVRATFDKAEYRDGLTAENRKMHDRVLEERNRYVAHSVDNREAAAMVYLVADEKKSGKREYIGVGTMAARHQLLSSEPADEFLRLLDEAEEAFDTLIAELSEAVDLQLRSLSLDQLYAVPNLSVRAKSVPRRKRVSEKPKARRASDGETSSPSIWVDLGAVPQDSELAKEQNSELAKDLSENG